ncbi:hypothetical protein H9P43_001358 [Blastocladiella emersonii ATCC 22665]|nr:hypothetical protein H9P43_001358 [Blastocladiella emersonii ATCC 22665]
MQRIAAASMDHGAASVSSLASAGRRGSATVQRVARQIGSISGAAGMGSGGGMNGSVASLNGSLYIPTIAHRTRLHNRRSPRRLLDTDLAAAAAAAAGAAPVPERSDFDEDVMVDPTRLDPYLVALSVCYFQPWVFLREFVYHVFQPVVLLTLFTHTGRLRARNRDFIGNTRSFYVQWVLFFMMTACCVIYVYDTPEHIGLEQQAILVGLWVFRQLVVATKHAFTSPLEQKEMEERVEPLEAREARQIITGWINPSKNLVETQILLASTRQSADLTRGQFFAVPPDTLPPPSAAPHPVPLMPKAVSGASENSALQEIHNRYNPFLDKIVDTALVSPLPASPIAGPGAGPGSPPQPSTPTSEFPPALAPAPQQHVPTMASPPTVRGGSGLRGSGNLLASGHPQPQAQPPPPVPPPVPRVSAWAVVNGLVDESNELKASPILFLGSAFIYSIIPIVTRFTEHVSPFGGSRWTAVVYTVCYFCLSYFLVMSNLAFVIVCMVDFQRRHYLFMRLNAILIDGFVRKPTADEEDGDDAAAAAGAHPPPPPPVPFISVAENDAEDEAAKSDPDPDPDGSDVGTGVRLAKKPMLATTPPRARPRLTTAAPAPVSAAAAAKPDGKSTAKRAVNAAHAGLPGSIAAAASVNPAAAQLVDLRTIRLDMHRSHNLLLWWFCRSVLQAYGYGFLQRISVYTGYFIVYALGVACILILLLLKYLPMNTSAGMLLAMANLAYLFASIAHTLYYGVLANDARKEHALTLLKKAIDISTRAERILLRAPPAAAAHDHVSASHASLAGANGNVFLVPPPGMGPTSMGSLRGSAALHAQQQQFHDTAAAAAGIPPPAATAAASAAAAAAVTASEMQRAANFCWVLAENCREDLEVSGLRVLGVLANRELLSSFATLMGALLSVAIQSLLKS